MNKEVIFASLIGLAVGGAIGGFSAYAFTKKKYVSILNETVDNYEKLLSEAERPFEDDVPDEYKRYIPKDESDTSDNDHKISEKDKEIIKEKLRYNNSKTISYNQMYNTPIKDIIDAQAESNEGEPDSEELEESEEEEAIEKSVNIFEAVKKNVGRSPVIVSEEDYNDILDNHSDVWNVDNLFLYNDGTVTTEDDKVIDPEEIERTLGGTLEKYDFLNSSEKTIYVKNFELQTVYEIVKINKPFIPN